MEIPAGRFGSPKEIADFVLSLAEGHNYITGQVITIDGGWM
jgi:3-oxoacyl-[acyl-carrier protein] reductase